MSFEAKVLADSVNPQGNRLITLQETYPRIIHAERMTHRIHSKNSASTRAIPLSNQIRNLLENPFIPEKFGVNQPGMQAYNHLAGLKHDDAVEVWLTGRDRALTTTIELILGREAAADVLGYEPTREFVHREELTEHFDELIELLPKSTDTIDLSETGFLNVHKQLAGRGLEAYMWHTIISSGTGWDNYFALRDHPEAQGEIATVARLTRKAIEASSPVELEHGQWHTPLVEPGEFSDPFDAIRASAARTAAVSYNRQSVKNFEKEVGRYNDLRGGGHMTPLEHQATPFSDEEQLVRRRMAKVARIACEQEGLSSLQQEQLVSSTEFLGNFQGWRQHRKEIEHEDNFGELRKVG